MIPSLVVSEIRSALVEYLASTFALSDEQVREALSSFLEDQAEGIFRGPYLTVRTPFRQVDASWQAPLDWMPAGFLPYEHQAKAFERLSSADGRTPSPTLVTTGTGSGKTECFLFPILDHCARLRAEGHSGIKALILYPMNALASDQAGRIAKLIDAETALAGVTAGLYVGEQGRHSSMGPDHIIDKREVLRADPPDILLTNYKMLDFLLLRSEDRDLWAVNEEGTLQYVVLDEFHTYDGAQGTDVAMLLRRLGATLGAATEERPLGSITPVATSATLGTGEDALAELRSFAGKVFGTDFAPDSVIGETRQGVDEACSTIDFLLPIPDVSEVRDLEDQDAVAAAFCMQPDDPQPIGDVVELGERLLAHPLTRAVLIAVGGRSRSWTDAVAEIVNYAPQWGRSLMTGDAAGVERALVQYLRLLSVARRREGERLRPLFSVEVQLWIREVSRLLRKVSDEPEFRWRDSAAVVDEHLPPPVPGSELPAIYCRRCGMSGWMAVASESSDAFGVQPAVIYRSAMSRSPLVRAFMRAHPDDADRKWYSPSERRLVTDKEADETDDKVPVLATSGDDDAKANRCPGCGERNSIRFVGLAVPSLASVSINTLFASPHLDSNERKLLAFTDSVQDASHRASFFGGRTHRINLRSLMSRIIVERGEVPLADMGDLLLAEAVTDQDRFGLVPPDLLRDPLIRTCWSKSPEPGSMELLAARLGFEADIEFGLRARVGRTLELSRVAAAAVRVDDFEGLVLLVAEELQRITGTTPGPFAPANYLRGVVERMRLRGGLVHPMLEPFIENGGRQWFIWGGRPAGLPPFTPDQGRPSFFTTAPKGDLDSVSAPTGPTLTWIVDWAVRSLGLDPAQARELNLWTLNLLGNESDAVISRRAGGNKVFGLDRRSVIVSDVPDDSDESVTSHLRCNVCGHVHVVSPALIGEWRGSPCLRYRCVGHFEPAPMIGAQYYRSLYRAGITRRVVTGEHTGLLGRQRREDLERSFKEGTAPDAPNLITATPTLEMGIDIGDLSAVMLTSVPRNPASYIQRVGRAGRANGNSLVTTFVRTDTHGLYYLADPEAMLAGDVRPPNCYLDAFETLKRQYVAYLIDRVADQTIDAPVPPRQIGVLVKSGLDDGGFLKAVIDASILDTVHVDNFLSLFGNLLAETTVDRLGAYAGSEIAVHIKAGVENWEAHRRDLDLRRSRLTGAIDRLGEKATLTHDEDVEIVSLRGQRAAIIRLLRDHREEYSNSALERLGLLPNYTLVDDSVTLSATMWSKNDDGSYETEILEYQRSGRLAINEFAPGNSFYAGGHRHMIDALEIGSAAEPLYETWRLCPDCGYATIEPEGEPPSVCPRCAGQAIADTGARHTILRLRAALASGSEENARVFDESDDRRRERYSTALVVDVEPEHIQGAWTLNGRAFGAEFAGRTHLRTLNLGFSERTGENLSIAGQKRHVTRFTVCRHCGSVAEARDDRNGANPERLHQGWCKVRSGSVKESWDPLLLLHELTTEAIRLLLPVSMFEVEERLASFKGALLLGLRDDLGGDPDHLEVALADSPNRGGQGRRRFLVLFDRVPGGTGYLARMGDPDRVRSILEAGRSAIARCPCTKEGRQACHRCLLGVVNRDEYDLARRDLALEILDDLLDSWETTPIATVGDLDIGKVEESELERRFKIALRDWAEGTPNENISFQTVPGSGKYAAFELRMEHNGVRTRYRIDEQEGLTTTPSTVPDYVIRRMDEKGPKIAVYLDGYQFHASPESNNIASDAQKRRGVRAENMLVWNVVWNDVEAFHNAVTADPPREPAPQTLLKGSARSKAQTIQHGNGGVFDVDALNQNSVALLLDYLARPDFDQWRKLALAAAGGVAAAAEWQGHLGSAEVAGFVGDALGGAKLAVHETATPGAAFAARTVTSNGLPLVFLLDTRDGAANDARWTAIATLDDSLHGDENEHRRRWVDWLHWANVLQFIKSPGRDAVISATSEAGSYPIEDLWIVDVVSSGATAATEPVALSNGMAEELELLDDAVEVLVRSALMSGAPEFTGGYELDGLPLEAAWPDRKVAVLVQDADGFSTNGWDARPVGAWSTEELIAVLKERS